MTSERWQSIELLFAELADLPPALASLMKRTWACVKRSSISCRRCATALSDANSSVTPKRVFSKGKLASGSLDPAAYTHVYNAASCSDSCDCVSEPLLSQNSSVQRTGNYEFALRLPSDGLFAQEEIELDSG